ncbi:MAG: methyltransferase domain-containing protein, partial [Pyrinomonadaceae bacterium]
LEAMAQRVPVLASGVCEVIVDHIKASGGGRIYEDYYSFANALSEMYSDQTALQKMGERGREYVLSHFTRERIKQSLIETIESCATAFAARNKSPAITVPSPSSSEVGRVYVEPKSVDISYARAVPLPAGTSEEQLRELLMSVQVEDGPVGELRNYARQDFKRFIYTLGLIPDRPGLVLLELGANPYFTTTLLHKFRDVESHLANFFGANAQEGSQRVMIHQTGEVITYPYKHFNIEEDVFPYPDENFDVVLFCEILEHLLSDPVHALVEIRRVLKPGGFLILTTPNVARLENTRKIIAGENIYDPYSGYGPYGRHNREYTQQDLFRLLSANGFRIGELFTADVNPDLPNSLPANDKLAPLVKNRHPELGQYIFCRCTLNGDAKEIAPVRPDWLYRSLSDESEGVD